MCEQQDDPDGRIAGTGKDNEFVGGFAGGGAPVQADPGLKAPGF